ncbi:response regulator [Streptomyces sp. NPDC001714]|uniref:response regulator n=1 Tax=Streptomyces sp. NPDC001714 TaxID=3364603 RepID=UPI00368056F8
MNSSTGTPRILVVDDGKDLTDLLVTVLRAEGWRTEPAPDGTTAMRAARGFRPDAVVLDRGLPDLEGLEVLRRLRACRPDLPVLFLTAGESVEDRVAGLWVRGPRGHHRVRRGPLPGTGAGDRLRHRDRPACRSRQPPARPLENALADRYATELRMRDFRSPYGRRCALRTPVR